MAAELCFVNFLSVDGGSFALESHIKHKKEI
jgi:hypothetical protein